jgi:hypothetical protein
VIAHQAIEVRLKQHEHWSPLGTSKTHNTSEHESKPIHVDRITCKVCFATSQLHRCFAMRYSCAILASPKAGRSGMRLLISTGAFPATGPHALRQDAAPAEKQADCFPWPESGLLHGGQAGVRFAQSVQAFRLYRCVLRYLSQVRSIRMMFIFQVTFPVPAIPAARMKKIVINKTIGLTITPWEQQ